MSRDSLLNVINKGLMEKGSNPRWGVAIYLFVSMLGISLGLTKTSCSIRSCELFAQGKGPGH